MAAGRPELHSADLALVARLERAALLAVPAQETWRVGGWLCQWGAGGHVGRVASACPAPFDGVPAAADVGAVAASYRARGLPPLLRLTPLAPTVEPVPSSRSPVVVMARSLPAVGVGEGAASGHRVALEEEAAGAWRATYAGSYLPDEGAARLDLALAAPRPRRFAVAEVGGRTAGLGLGVVVDGALGVFDVLTVEPYRRRGVAQAVMIALLGWATSVGADLAYLQVSAGNAPALALYELLGFEPAYTYVYSSTEDGSAPSR